MLTKQIEKWLLKAGAKLTMVVVSALLAALSAILISAAYTLGWMITTLIIPVCVLVTRMALETYDQISYNNDWPILDEDWKVVVASGVMWAWGIFVVILAGAVCAAIYHMVAFMILSGSLSISRLLTVAMQVGLLLGGLIGLWIVARDGSDFGRVGGSGIGGLFH